MRKVVGLDISLNKTSVCILELDGTIVWQGKVDSEPGPIIDKLAAWQADIDKVGLEACPLSEWLHRHLTEAGFTAVCVETNHAQRFLSTRPVKTDKNDARGLAEMMRIGHYRAVHVKSFEAQMVRTTLQARRQIVAVLLQIQGTIRGLLRMHSLKMGTTHHSKFSERVCELLAEKPILEIAIGPLLRSVEQLANERKEMDKVLQRAARRDDVCLRLMTIPGVGPITSLAYRATVDDPARITSSKAVGALLGLTPRIYQPSQQRSVQTTSKTLDMNKHNLIPL